MIGKKIAFLLDFDGPFFNNDLVKGEILSFLGMREDQWKKAYQKSSEKGKYTSYGQIISLLTEQSTANEALLWEHLYNIMKGEQFCTSENKKAMRDLASMGHVEVITQGDEVYQWLKLITSTINDIINTENSKRPEGDKHTVRVVEENKNIHLRARLKGLWEDGYTVIQIDDRAGPLLDLQEFAKQQNIWHGEFFQYRINVGKYAEVPSPKGHNWQDMDSISEAVRDIRTRIIPQHPEGGCVQSIRMKR